MGLSAGLLSAIPFASIKLSDNKLNELLKFVSDSELPVNKNEIGQLTDSEFNTLASLCNYVNDVWDLNTDLSKYLGILKFDLAFKTKEKPSYLTEYKNAIKLINLVVEKSQSINQAWTSLLFEDFEKKDLSATKIGRARKFVFSELITHLIPISEGFKSFSLSNYRGYFGGSFYSPDSYKKIIP